MKKTTNVHSSYFIDTNIFLRTLVPENQKMHHECVAFLRAVREGEVQAYTSPVVIAEVVWTLTSYYKVKKPQVLEAVQGILHLRHLRIEARERAEVALEIYATHTIKFIDALIASASEVGDGTVFVLSYDREFDRIPGVVRKEPGEVVDTRE